MHRAQRLFDEMTLPPVVLSPAEEAAIAQAEDDATALAASMSGSRWTLTRLEGSKHSDWLVIDCTRYNYMIMPKNVLAPINPLDVSYIKRWNGKSPGGGRGSAQRGHLLSLLGSGGVRLVLSLRWRGRCSCSRAVFHEGFPNSSG